MGDTAEAATGVMPRGTGAASAASALRCFLDSREFPLPKRRQWESRTYVWCATQRRCADRAAETERRVARRGARTTHQCRHRKPLSIALDAPIRRSRVAGMRAGGALEARGSSRDGFGLYRVLANRPRRPRLEILAKEIRVPWRHSFFRARKMGQPRELGLRPLRPCGK